MDQPLPPTTQPVRAVVWALHLALPLLGLWLLLAQPHLDIELRHGPSHFWLIFLVAGVNVVVGTVMSEAARHRRDARLFLVSLVFISSAGFFLLHALATPGMIVDHPNTGFDVAQPVGLALAGIFAFLSSLPMSAPTAAAVLRFQGLLRGMLGALLVGWAVWSLADLAPLSNLPPERNGPVLTILGIVSVILYGAAALRYFLLHRSKPSAMLISVITAYALLAETMVAGVLATNWHLSWWEWHLLLTFAFGFVAYSAYIQFRREGSSAGIFDSIALSATARRVQAEYGAALEELVNRLRAGGGPTTATRLAGRFKLTEGQAAVLDRAGHALASERELSERLSALVDVGNQARVGLSERDFLAAAIERVRQAYGDVRITLISDGRIDPPRPGVTAHSLTVKGHLAGRLEIPEREGAPDQALAATLASQLSIALENARLYQELETLFHQYMSPDVAASLLADPEQARLGGELVEVTALFADLRGFTTFSEQVQPGEIVEMLNRYHAAAVPCVLRNGGTIVQFVGDALLALFNAPARQPDHPAHAARAGLGIQRAVDVIARGAPGWPRFRVGINTGPALVGNIGSPELRGFNAMGDAVNVAARLQGLAEPGQVVIGAATYAGLGAGATVKSLGELVLKGKVETVHAYVLEEL